MYTHLKLTHADLSIGWSLPGIDPAARFAHPQANNRDATDGDMSVDLCDKARRDDRRGATPHNLGTRR